MLFEQITLDDDSQINTKLASRVLLRLYATMRSGADVALALLQIGTKCLPPDPESFGMKAVDINIALPDIHLGQPRSYLHDEMIATETTKDKAYMRSDRLQSESKKKESRASGAPPHTPKRWTNQKKSYEGRAKNASQKINLGGKKPPGKRKPVQSAMCATLSRNSTGY